MPFYGKSMVALFSHVYCVMSIGAHVVARVYACLFLWPRYVCHFVATICVSFMAKVCAPFCGNAGTPVVQRFSANFYEA